MFGRLSKATFVGCFRKTPGNQNWNPPSRADSMSSLISIPNQVSDEVL